MKNEYIENSVIGVLIGYYRKRKNDLGENPNFKKNRFLAYKSDLIQRDCLNCKNLQCKKRSAICTHNTFSAIEKGETVKKICCYIDFADKLGMIYKLNKSMVAELEQLETQIIQALEFNDVNQYLELYKLATQKQREYAQVIYFSEIYELCLNVLKVQITQEFPDNSFIELLEFIFPYLTSKNKYLSCYLLYRFYSIHDDLYDKEKLFLDNLCIMNPNNVEFFIRSKLKSNSLLEVYCLLSDFSKEGLNDYERYTIYQSMGYICFGFNQIEDGLHYVNQSKDIIEQSSITFPRKEVNQTYMRLGFFYYQLKDYNCAIQYFSKVYKANPGTLLLNILLFFNAFEKLDRIKDLNKLLKTVNLQRIERHKKIVIYYQMKYIHKSSCKELEEYIIERIKPMIPKNTVYHQVITEELLYLTNQTTDYKILYNYLS